MRTAISGRCPLRRTLSVLAIHSYEVDDVQLLGGVEALRGETKAETEEVRWLSRYWELIEPEVYEGLRPVYQASLRKRRCKVVTELLGHEAAEWTTFGGRVVYVPTLCELTTVARRLERDQVSNWKRDWEASSDYAVYGLVYSSLTPKQWERMRKVTIASFANCNLAYVELASMISNFVQMPYGTVDAPIRRLIMNQMGIGASVCKFRFWTTGCLLQYSGTTIESLIDFCTTELGYNPVSDSEGQRNLQCLKMPQGYNEYSRRGKKDAARRKEILLRKLDKLPTVSVSEFGTMTRSSLNERLNASPNTFSGNTFSDNNASQDTTNQDTTNQDTTNQDTTNQDASLRVLQPQEAWGKWRSLEKRTFPWAAQYWKTLEKMEYKALRGGVSTLPMVRRRSWKKVGHLLPKQFPCDEWTMVVNDGEPRPLYIPTLAISGMRKMDCNAVSNTDSSTGSNTDWNRDFAAYRTIHGSLTEDQWKRLRTVNVENFSSCNLAFVGLAAIISSFVDAPYGLLDIQVARKLGEKLKASYSSNRLRRWMTGCLLEHCGVSTDSLADFCVTQLGFKPPVRYPTRAERFAKCLCQARTYTDNPDRDACRTRLKRKLRGLPTVTAEEFSRLDKKTCREKLAQSRLTSVAPEAKEPRKTAGHKRRMTDPNCGSSDYTPPPSKRNAEASKQNAEANCDSSCLLTGQLEQARGQFEQADNDRLSRLIMDLSKRMSLSKPPRE
ncbi:hypothetical protein GNI_035860 [Gregarina niphandrodes]|uniref:Uncharacterized protein n=1 Tax=Gregarina niphandrodes TaxID=110365 RepID=A0A023BAP8_GRENI|nr:hypothetical protein GNI_035860 [Gregarina niphandrodes]EZG78462.1 hypothetical protein GNI_035860 [Gregarina niphandrodes]|eukprot:XP_011129287.1 hypothetical protein GNI_035860 [Gregarina niphandrodes]